MLPIVSCPHCGALPNAQLHSKNCSVNIAPTIEAAVAEKNKIAQLKSELSQTIRDLRSEALYVENIIPEINQKLKSVEGEIEEISPIIKKNAATFSELLEKRTFLREVISANEQIKVLIDMKQEAEEEAKTKPKKSKEKDETTFSQSLLDELARQIESILKAWEFPDADRVFFDTATNDLTIRACCRTVFIEGDGTTKCTMKKINSYIWYFKPINLEFCNRLISGKCRKDRGKGMRSVIHAAFNIGLLSFCKKHNRPHLGFVILDSPLGFAPK